MYPIFVKKRNDKILLKIKVIDEIILLKIKNINIESVLASLTIVKILGLDFKKILKIFSLISAIKGRGKTHIVKRYNKNFKLIDESYNANPFSVKNAIINLSQIKKKNCKKYLLLGDMLELGKKSDFFHKNLSKIINKTDIDKIFIYGDKVFNTYKNINTNKQGNILQNLNDFDDIFSKTLKKNDYLMIKGSNSTGLKKNFYKHY